MLDIPSKVIKDDSNREPVDDILAILRAIKAQFVYTHNLADKHDTHVAVILRVVDALRKIRVCNVNQPKHHAGHFEKEDSEKYIRLELCTLP